jgi:hypothetical protein
LTLRRKLDFAPGPIQKRATELMLEIANLLADGGLRDIQPPGRCSHAAKLRNRLKVPEMPKLHTIILSVFPMRSAGKNCEYAAQSVMSF